MRDLAAHPRSLNAPVLSPADPHQGFVRTSAPTQGRSNQYMIEGAWGAGRSIEGLDARSQTVTNRKGTGRGRTQTQTANKSTKHTTPPPPNLETTARQSQDDQLPPQSGMDGCVRVWRCDECNPLSDWTPNALEIATKPGGRPRFSALHRGLGRDFLLSMEDAEASFVDTSGAPGRCVGESVGGGPMSCTGGVFIYTPEVERCCVCGERWV